jgi:hypothetical protein
MTKQPSMFTPADELTDVLGMELFRHSRPGNELRGMAYIEARSIPEPMSGCWLWLGSVDENGYGLIRKATFGEGFAHRYSLISARGPIGAMRALHHCDQPSCVCPDHLFPGTAQDNMDDMVRRGRASKLRGEDLPGSVLTEAQVRSIRDLYVKNSRVAGAPSLAKHFGVARQTILHVVNGERWGHVA